MKFSAKAAAVMAGMALVLPLAATAPAQAGTKPPPCTKKAVKKALKADMPGESIKLDGKPVCQNYWAAGAFTIDDMDDAAYLLQDNGGKWQVVGSKKEAKLCKPSNTTLPKKIKKRACVS